MIITLYPMVYSGVIQWCRLLAEILMHCCGEDEVVCSRCHSRAYMGVMFRTLDIAADIHKAGLEVLRLPSMGCLMAGWIL